MSATKKVKLKRIRRTKPLVQLGVWVTQTESTALYSLMARVDELAGGDRTVSVSYAVRLAILLAARATDEQLVEVM